MQKSREQVLQTVNWGVSARVPRELSTTAEAERELIGGDAEQEATAPWDLYPELFNKK